MAKEASGNVPLQKKIDVVVNLLALVGAEKVGDDNWHILIDAKKNEKNHELCKAIVVACDIAIAHLQNIKIFL